MGDGRGEPQLSANELTIESKQFGQTTIAEVDLQVLSRFTGLSRDDCIERLAQYRLEDIAEEWRDRDPKSRGDIQSFYSDTDHYIWELLAYNGSEDYRRWYVEPLERAAAQWPPTENPRALDHGSGVGTVAIRLAELGYRVTLSDIAGRTLEFAKARLAARGIEFDAIEVGDRIRDALRPRSYSVVVSYDVLEHVPDPATEARGIIRALRPGGAAVIMADFTPPNPLWPHHLPEGARRFAGHRWKLFLDGLGLKAVDDPIYVKLGGAAAVARRLRYGLWRATSIYAERRPR